MRCPTTTHLNLNPILTLTLALTLTLTLTLTWISEKSSARSLEASSPKSTPKILSSAFMTMHAVIAFKCELVMGISELWERNHVTNFCGSWG